MRRIVTLAIALALCAALSACGSSRPSSPKAVRASIVAAALAQTSVHWTEIARPHMLAPTRWSSDVNAGSGMQRVTFAPGTRDAGTARLRLVDRTVYVRGDAVGLEKALNLSEASAKRYTGKWISIPKGDELYDHAADGLTLASIVHDVTPPGRLSLVKKTSHGTSLLVLQGRVWPFAILSARASGEPLPVSFSFSNCLGCELTGRFSRWNEPVHVRAPASSIPIAIVRGKPNGVLKSIVAAGLAQKSVHMTATVFAGLIGKIAYSVDVSRTSVAERIKYRGRRMRVLVFDHAVYLRAAALLLRERLGLTPEQAKRYAGQWIWIPQAGGEHRLYAELTSGLTFSSIIVRATRMTNLKLSRAAGFLVVRGTPALPRLPVEEVKARASGTPLPVAFSGRLPGAWTSGRFSKWNEPVVIQLPESSTPIAIVRGS